MNKLSVRDLALAGVMAAVLCVLGPWTINIPVSPVPVSLGMLGIYLTVTVLGMRLGSASVIIYILLGLAGLPVFTGFSAGPGKLLGPTGGYIIGYVFMALICGFFTDRAGRSLSVYCLGMFLGTAVCYLFGTLWLAGQMQYTFFQALMAGVIPYIPADLIKLVIARVLGFKLRGRLLRAGLIKA